MKKTIVSCLLYSFVAIAGNEELTYLTCDLNSEDKVVNIHAMVKIDESIGSISYSGDYYENGIKTNSRSYRRSGIFAVNSVKFSESNNVGYEIDRETLKIKIIGKLSGDESVINGSCSVQKAI